MVRVRYIGLSNPQAAFAELRPYRQRLIQMQMSYRPFGPEFRALLEAQEALDRAAAHFTGDPAFYGRKPHSS